MRRLASVPLLVVYTNSARKELAQFTETDSDALRHELEVLAQTGFGDITLLEGIDGVFRLRSGRTRAEFFVIQQDHVLTVIRVFYRQQGYGLKGRSRRK